MMSGYGTESIVFLVLYMLFLLLAGMHLFRTVKPEAEEYLLMGRRLSLPAFVASLVSTWYGGILGVGEYSYKHGLSNWLVFGVPYYLAAFIFAIFIAEKAHASKVLTIPDQFEKVYGRNAAIIGAVFVFINAVPAAYILQVGVLANSVFGIPLVPAVIGGAIFSIFYVYSGGLKGDVFTDIIQFFLMFAGFIIICVALFVRFGFWDFLSTSLPASSFSWNGGKTASYVFVWYFIAMATLVEPTFYQRCFASRSGAAARKGILISIAFWAFFDFMTTLSGMYARAIMPDLADPVSAYPALGARILSPFFQAIFLLGLFATVMSTVDSYALVAGTTIGKDIIGRMIRREKLGSLDMTLYSRLGLVFASAIAIAIALYFRSVIDIWYNFGTVTTVALLVPLASSFSRKPILSPAMAITSILVSTAIVLVWIIPKLIYGTPYHFGIEPIYPGLLVSISIFVFGLVRRKNREIPLGAKQDD